MRALFTLLCLVGALQAQTNQTVSLLWDYDTTELTSNLVFRAWHSTDVRVAVTNWENVATFKVVMPQTTGAHFYVVSAAYVGGTNSVSPTSDGDSWNSSLQRFDGSKKGKL